MPRRVVLLKSMTISVRPRIYSPHSSTLSINATTGVLTVTGKVRGKTSKPPLVATQIRQASVCCLNRQQDSTEPLVVHMRRFQRYYFPNLILVAHRPSSDVT